MAEALGVSSAVITLASTAYKSCQTLHNAVDGYRSAHSQFLALSADLETFYLVLGTLQAALQEEAASAAAVEAVMSEGLSKALEESMDVFKRISAVVQAFGASRTAERSSLAGTLQKAKWVLNEKAIANLRKDLLDCKMSLNIAICVTNEYNLRAVRTSMAQMRTEVSSANSATVSIEFQMAERMQELRSKLPAVLEQQEDILALGLPAPKDHSQQDRMNVRIDLGFNLRRFANSAAASLSSSHPPQTPSFQVSSFEIIDSTQASTYDTALSRRDDTPLASIACGSIQIFVRNAGNSKTLACLVDPDSTVEQLKDQVRKRIGLSQSQFSFVHSGKLIPRGSEKTLRECGVSKDDTFTCVSFLAVPLPPPAPPLPMIKIIVKMLNGRNYTIRVRSTESIWALKVECAKQMAKSRTYFRPKILPSAHDIEFVYKGIVLEDDSSVSNPRFITNGEDLVIWALISLDAERPNLEKLNALARAINEGASRDEIYHIKMKRFDGKNSHPHLPEKHTPPDIPQNSEQLPHVSIYNENDEGVPMMDISPAEKLRPLIEEPSLQQQSKKHSIRKAVATNLTRITKRLKGRGTRT